MTTRRQVLRAAGGAMTVVIGGIQVACTPDETARIDAANLRDDEILTLVRISQHILPHASLDAGVFRDSVTKLADSIVNDADRRRVVVDGIAALNENSTWLDAAHGAQRTALIAMENSQFFHILQNTTLENVYRDERAWQMVGFEGDAMRFGGYVDRGFDDIDWLPIAPDQEQSN